MYKCINGWTKEKMKEQIKLKNNGKKSTGHKEHVGLNCSYRGLNNNACLVGCFIPDEKYTIDMDGVIIELINPNSHNLSSFMPLEYQGLCIFQLVHDNADPNDNIHELAFKWIDENVQD